MYVYMHDIYKTVYVCCREKAQYEVHVLLMFFKMRGDFVVDGSAESKFVSTLTPSAFVCDSSG